MSFWYAQTQQQAARVKTVKSGKPTGIPVDSLNKLGCSACPRNKNCRDLQTPKIKPSGSDRPLLYLLDTSPSFQHDDRAGEFFADPRNRALFRAFDAGFVDRDVRMGAVVQCAEKEDKEPTDGELESCRPRVVADIEDSQPLVVVGVGPVAMKWATGLDGGVGLRRGRLIPTRIGKHECWYMAIPENWWLRSKKGNYGPSEHEKVFEADLEWVRQQIKNGLDFPVLAKAPYDAGIEYITGTEPGDMDRLKAALDWCALQPDVAIDYETNALSPWQVRDPKIYLAAVGTEARTIAFTLDHPEGWMTPQKRRQAWALLGEFLVHSGSKVAHSLSMELKWSAWFFGPEVLRASSWEDTMAQAHTLDERQGQLSLDDQVRYRCGFFLKAQNPVDPVRLLEYPLRTAMRYNGMDTKWTHGVWTRTRAMVEDNPDYMREYQRKVRLASTLVLSEIKGLPADMDYARDMERKLTSEVSTIIKKFQHLPSVRKFAQKYDRPFKPSAPADVLDLIHGICGRDELLVKDKGGKAVKKSTNEDYLSLIPTDECPEAGLVLEYRGIEKLLSTYIRPIVDGTIVSRDGYIHPTYNSMVAVTGRLSANDPNIQNFPVRKHKEVRGVVYAPDGRIFVAKDYGAIEARVIAMASEDQNLVKYMWTGYDIHGYWSARILDIFPEWSEWVCEEVGVDPKDEKAMKKAARQEAKNKWVFPQFFGASHFSCASNLHVPNWVAEDLAGEFWDEFRGVKRWQERLLKSYDKNLYVETLTGRRRRGAMSPNEIINTPIQGTAADIVTAAMTAMSERAIIDDNFELQPNLNVHDDLSTVPPIDGLQKHIDTCVYEMCKHRFDFIIVPLVVEVKTGPRWNELKEVAVYRSNEIFNLPNPYEVQK